MFRICGSRIGNLDGRVRQSLWPFVRPDLFQKFNRQGLITVKRSFENILKLFGSERDTAGFVGIEISFEVLPRPCNKVVVELRSEDRIEALGRRDRAFEFLNLLIYCVLNYVLSKRRVRDAHDSFLPGIDTSK